MVFLWCAPAQTGWGRVVHEERLPSFPRGVAANAPAPLSAAQLRQETRLAAVGKDGYVREPPAAVDWRKMR